MRYVILSMVILVFLSNKSQAQCSNFTITFDPVEISPCTNGEWEVCVHVNVGFSSGNASWKYGWTSDEGSSVFLSELLTTDNVNDVDMCTTIPCDEGLLFYVNTWSSPNGGGNMCEWLNGENLILDVKLDFFKGEFEKDRIVLDWKTLSEVNSDRFILEKSKNSRAYYEISEIKSKGNSYESNRYNFVDEEPYFGQNYYRLSEVSLDGSIEYFPDILVNTNVGSKDNLISPNPASRRIRIKNEGQFSQIQFLNNRGEKCKLIRIESNESSIDVSDLRNGMYTVLFIGRSQILAKEKLYILN